MSYGRILCQRNRQKYRREVRGRIGRVTGDTKTQAAGLAKQVSGAAQDIYGQARDAASDAAGTARDTASSFEKMLRNTIEISHTHPLLSRLALDGCWAECTDPFSETSAIPLVPDRILSGRVHDELKEDCDAEENKDASGSFPRHPQRRLLCRKEILTTLPKMKKAASPRS